MLDYHISMLFDCFIKVYLLCVLTMVIILLEYISIGVNIGTNHLRYLQHFSNNTENILGEEANEFMLH